MYLNCFIKKVIVEILTVSGVQNLLLLRCYIQNLVWVGERPKYMPILKTLPVTARKLEQNPRRNINFDNSTFNWNFQSNKFTKWMCRTWYGWIWGECDKVDIDECTINLSRIHLRTRIYEDRSVKVPTKRCNQDKV